MRKFSFRVIPFPWLHLALISSCVVMICIVFVVCIEYYEITVLLQVALHQIRLRRHSPRGHINLFMFECRQKLVNT